MVTAIPQFENFAIPLITLQNLKILLSWLLLCHIKDGVDFFLFPKCHPSYYFLLISKFYQLATWIFFVLLIQLKFFGDR